MHRVSPFVGVKLLAAAAALGVAGWATTDAEVSAQGKTSQHPHLHRALRELRQAHHTLKEAQGQFGGHRAEALRDVDRAIRQVERALHHQPNGTRRTSGVGGTGRSTTKVGGTTSTSPGRGSSNGVLIIPQK